MRLTGLIAATFTPLKEDGEVNFDAIPEMIERLVEQDIAGIYICGSTGEGHSLSTSDRKKIAEKSLEANNGRMKIIINVGHNSISDSCELARHARDIKVDAISAAPPVYYKISSEAQLIRTFEKITNEVPEVPFYYYHIPALTGFNFDMEKFLTLSSKKLPSLCGIKFTSPDIHEYQNCLNLSKDNFQILYGKDEMLLSGLVVGAESAVGSTYNFMAPLYHSLIREFREGNLKKAAQLQLEAVKIIKAFLKYDSFPAQKAMMKMIGIDCGPVALPLLSLTPEEEDDLRQELEKTTFFDWAPVVKK
ncbi:dihydrodipicolinate synthase family protein [uncultured Salegentibacter sp.]|uniref:dihydrodipicolinate synthase family protein n=1 Tax=uncultured Salegentibacter sp. TaxID=259320 RepID=UPI002599C3D5|nr:dihydrodipicolinate synthase family protein [uncultured Salegentibacter sp.]